MAARYGPYHHRCERRPEDIDAICASGLLWGRPRRNYFAGLFPAVKACEGPLPAGAIGIEFDTDVPPDSSSIPAYPEWTEGRPGVLVLEPGELVAIPIVVTMHRKGE